MTFTKDQRAAIMRHVYTLLGGMATGGTAVAVAFGSMTQTDADRIIAAAQQLGDGIGAIMTAAGVIIGVISALRAGKSASPEEQIRKVDQDPNNGVTVVAVTEEGAKTLEKISQGEK